MNKIEKEERAWAVLLRLVLIGIAAFGVLLAVGCEPEGCWDCTSYLVDGEYSEVCVQVDDSYCE